MKPGFTNEADYHTGGLYREIIIQVVFMEGLIPGAYKPQLYLVRIYIPLIRVRSNLTPSGSDVIHIQYKNRAHCGGRFIWD